MRVEAKNGKVAYLNIIGEDGTGAAPAEAANLLDDVGYDVLFDAADFDDTVKFTDYCLKNKMHAVVVDSLKEWYLLAMRKKIARSTPGDLDRAPKAGSFGDNEWPDIHQWMHNAVNRLRRSAKYVIVLCPSDKGQDQLKAVESGIAVKDAPVVVYPDVPGKMAQGCISWFDLVAYLQADLVKDTKNPGKFLTKRTLIGRKNPRYLTRTRFPKEFAEDIEVPTDGGGWSNLLVAINTIYQGEGEKK